MTQTVAEKIMTAVLEDVDVDTTGYASADYGAAQVTETFF